MTTTEVNREREISFNQAADAHADIIGYIALMSNRFKEIGPLSGNVLCGTYQSRQMPCAQKRKKGRRTKPKSGHKSQL